MLILYNYIFFMLGAWLIAQFIRVLYNIRLSLRELWTYILSIAILNGTARWIGGFIPYLPLPIISLLIHIGITKLLFKFNIYQAFTSVATAFITLAIGDAASYGILIKGFHLPMEYARQNVILVGISNLITYAVAGSIVLIIQVIKTKLRFKRIPTLNQNVITMGYILITLLLIASNFALYYQNYAFINRPFVLINFIIMIIYFVFSLFVLFISNKLTTRTQENEQLKVYVDTIEQLSLELRRFRHNFSNILHGLGGYIEHRDLNGLEKYFKEIVEQNKKLKNDNFFSIQKIKNLALRGLLSAKISKAESAEIDMVLEVTEDIENIPMRDIDLCEVVGVLMDNAIEAAAETSEKKIRMAFIEEEQYILIVLQNHFKERPKIERIFDKGFSTKGEHRGLGLWSVKKILSHDKDILLNTLIEGDWFTQEINIKK